MGCFIFLEYKLQINANQSLRSCTHVTGFKSQLYQFLLCDLGLITLCVLVNRGHFVHSSWVSGRNKQIQSRA